MLVGLGVVVRGAWPRRRTGRPRGCSLAGAVLALAGPSLVGHTRAFTPSPLLVAADVLHVTAGAVWLGGLVGLVLTMRALAGREVLAAETLARFSTLAGGVLLAVAATGTFLAWRIVGSWTGLVETAYGWLLLTKVAIALVVAGDRRLEPLAGAAAVPRGGRLRRPRARGRRGDPDGAGRGGAARGAARRDRLPRQPVPAPRPGHRRLGHDGRRGRDRRRPARARGDGPAAYGLQHTPRAGAGRGGRAVRPAHQPRRLPAAPTGLDIGEVTMAPIGAGTYRGEVVVPRPGEWEVQVSIRLSRFENPVTTVRVNVSR